MPSAASVKVDKPPTTNILANNAVAANKEAAAPSENVDNSSPVRQISLIIEHKIRNLEKRKVSTQHQKKNRCKSKQHFCVICTQKVKRKKTETMSRRTNTVLARVPCADACFFFVVGCVAHIMELCVW